MTTETKPNPGTTGYSGTIIQLQPETAEDTLQRIFADAEAKMTPKEIAEANARLEVIMVEHEANYPDWSACSLSHAPIRYTGDKCPLCEALKPKMFPIMYARKDRPGPTRIPWALADVAYSVYSAKYGRDQTLERLAQRGGFGASEMDIFLPDWREQVHALSRPSEAPAPKPEEVKA